MSNYGPNVTIFFCDHGADVVLNTAGVTQRCTIDYDTMVGTIDDQQVVLRIDPERNDIVFVAIGEKRATCREMDEGRFWGGLTEPKQRIGIAEVRARLQQASAPAPATEEEIPF